jgi:hypothetical protein
MSRRGSGRAGGRGKGKGRGAAEGQSSAALVAATSGLSSGDWLDLNLSGDMANTFGDVTYSEAEILARPGLYAGEPNNVLEDWNGSAFNPSTNKMYFIGGGHDAYGGNELYSLDLNTLTWARETEAANLTLYEPVWDNWLPADDNSDGISDTPPVPHTYNLLTFMPGYGNEGGLLLPDMVGVYKGTHPSEQDKNFILDIETLTWASYDGHGFFYGTAVQTPYGVLAQDGRGAHNHPLYMIHDDGTEEDLATTFTGQTGGTGMSLWHPALGEIYTQRRDGMWRITGSGTTWAETFITAMPAGYDPFDLQEQMGMAIGPDSKIYMNNGTRPVAVFDPYTDTYSLLDNTGSADAPDGILSSKGGGKVFSKFHYDAPSGSFVMVVNQDEIWVYKL